MKAFLASLLLAGSLSPGVAATINSTNRLAYGANIGWIDWRHDTNSGAVIGEYVCSGYIYAANIGWIHLGSNAPANGIRYQNNSATDYGVNHDWQGNLRGFAYGANIGWINFEANGSPRVDLKTGKFGGYIYSANCGWISLSNLVAFLQTDTIANGQADANGLPIAWQLEHFGHSGVDPNGDPDRDGMSNEQEYLAGTDPNDPGDKLVITSLTLAPGGNSATLTWKSAPTRCYYIQKVPDLNSTSWLDSSLGLIAPDGASTTRAIADSNAQQRFYRIQAIRPLSP